MRCLARRDPLRGERQPLLLQPLPVRRHLPRGRRRLRLPVPRAVRWTEVGVFFSPRFCNRFRHLKTFYRGPCAQNICLPSPTRPAPVPQVPAQSVLQGRALQKRRDLLRQLGRRHLPVRRGFPGRQVTHRLRSGRDVQLSVVSRGRTDADKPS